jgi:hypothetical protein
MENIEEIAYVIFDNVMSVLGLVCDIFKSGITWYKICTAWNNWYHIKLSPFQNTKFDIIFVPDISLFQYFMSELTRGYFLENDKAKYAEKRKRVYTFMQIPREMESVSLFWIDVDTSMWTPLCGHLHMDTSMWTPPCGHLRVDTSVWTPPCGQLCVDTSLWIPLTAGHFSLLDNQPGFGLSRAVHLTCHVCSAEFDSRSDPCLIWESGWLYLITLVFSGAHLV